MRLWTGDQNKNDQSHGMSLAPITRWGGASHYCGPRIAQGRNELQSAFKIAYANYLTHGYTKPAASSLLYRPAFGLATSRTIVTIDQANQVTGTLTVISDNTLQPLQVETTYPDEVNLLRQCGRKLAEISCLAIDTCNLHESLETFFVLTHFMIHYSLWRQFDDLIVTLHPRHETFYRRCFPIERIGPMRSHQPACNNPAIFCRLNLRTIFRKVRSDVGERYTAKQIPVDEFKKPGIALHDHRYFCSLVGIPIDDSLICQELRRAA